jgi:hypothetical protein
MKKLWIYLIIFHTIVACDAPQRTRAPVTYLNGNSMSSQDNPGNQSGQNGSSLSSSPFSTNSSTTSPSPETSQPGFAQCDLSEKYHTIDIGFFGVCQSTEDETQVKIKTSLAHSSIRICLIPTYKDQSGSSTYIGQPQCTFTSAQQVITGKLFKDRQGFSQHSLNGIIVMKEPLLNEYFSCMQAFVNWPNNTCANPSNPQYCNFWKPRCPYGGPTNIACDTEAKNYMSIICNGFKTKYKNAYADIRLK